MLTINADDHALMRNFHKAQDEKRMIVILPPARYNDWLQANASESGEFLQAWPADDLKTAAPQDSFPQTGLLF
jgi:putative SOS response-associated peptidase YedK